MCEIQIIPADNRVFNQAAAFRRDFLIFFFGLGDFLTIAAGDGFGEALRVWGKVPQSDTGGECKNGNLSFSKTKLFPSTAEILMSGSKDLKICRFKSSKPLKTDKTITKAMVPTPIPNIEIMEIKLIKLFFFLEKKYRLAIKSDKFKSLKVVIWKVLNQFELFIIINYLGLFLKTTNKLFLNWCWRNNNIGKKCVHFLSIFCSIINIKLQKRNNSKLMTHSFCQMITYYFGIFSDNL